MMSHLKNRFLEGKVRSAENRLYLSIFLNIVLIVVATVALSL